MNDDRRWIGWKLAALAVLLVLSGMVMSRPRIVATVLGLVAIGGVLGILLGALADRFGTRRSDAAFAMMKDAPMNRRLPGWNVVPAIDSIPINLAPYHLREDEHFLYLCYDDSVVALFQATTVSLEILQSAIVKARAARTQRGNRE